MMTMIHDKSLTVRCFFRLLCSAVLPRAGRGTLLTACAALLSSIASGQVPTVTALPVVTQYQTFHVVPNVISVPAAASGSGFAALLGGGLGAILTETTAPAAAAAATAATRALLIAQKTKIIQAVKTRLREDAEKAIQDVKNENPEVTQCEQAETCTIAEEEEAAQSQDELEALTESGQATQEAIEGAEAGEEAAEVTAEAAEVALEVAEETIEVLEIIVDLADILAIG